jgi:glycerophosphoryl diester phosphodiesterase
VFIQSFELANLRRLRHELMPARGLALPLVFLLGDVSGRSDPATSNFGQPYDVVWHARRGDDLTALYGPLAGALGLHAGSHYGEFLGPAALAALRREVDGLGPWIPSLVQAVPAPEGAADPRPRLGPAMAPWLAEARRLGFAVHAYTLRPEPPFRLLDAGGQELSSAELLRHLVAAGITGIFADAPGEAVALGLTVRACP